MIPLFSVSMSPDVAPALEQVLMSGYIGQGSKVDAFEEALRAYTGRTPITVNSGTSALTMALRLADVGPGDLVISTPMTCSATNIPILSLGARPLWADIDERTGLIDPVSVHELYRKSRTRKRIKAVMAVDWGGQPCDYDELKELELPIIEDAAHAFGASYKRQKIGMVADYTCFSFQAIKHLTTGDGGALIPPSYAVKRAKDMRWFGLDRSTNTGFRGEQDITEWGYKFHMNDINATIGLVNLERIDRILSHHRLNAELYDDELDARFTRTKPTYDHQGSWWLYTVLLPNRQERDAFKTYMDASGIAVSQVHWRNDRQTVFRTIKERDLPGVDVFSNRMICLPVHPMADVPAVIKAANAFYE